MTDRFRSALFIAICLVDVAAIGFGLTLAITGV